MFVLAFSRLFFLFSLDCEVRCELGAVIFEPTKVAGVHGPRKMKVAIPSKQSFFSADLFLFPYF
jgi:hypothetical protein